MEESSETELADPQMVTPRLIALREALGLGKGEFADSIGLDRSSYSKIEKANKPILPPTAQKIWKLYGVDMNYIYLGRVDTLPAHLSSKITKTLTAQN
ncbi:helix-turn-helix transcriptional regulator [Sulfitobacter mediterraneus]|uniref:helix-turn-helix domain-containing protein n=1 Tax=Sulfitobacter mediterraneus TaxID=83219 RepID=UPI00193A88E2|nr:helix-turn-helix transcriptional regulator [Sulfitobacter mediterraneus]MBM1556689.1 helix-turn-helix transcriptional regulator [Sulfitobacter mediterraneus]MBM1570114.1 helix-turn-helix transcriptional regulator [Sulfitobacter mediterraneus]MBM1574071.1 helix-turn-helix transcriptional regulator [Sulfitobacter mediterraneus]MBM1577856.1 helix-turn-helix transcriptional regulator [Sulfitobacter mediterraneus]MBM1579647.1 helix-turn-helix transcriptional regulator [Sulfitobacter mediterraneu